MGVCMISSPNLVAGASVSGGSWTAGMPLSNILDRTIGLKARSSDDAAASTQFELALSGPMSVRVLALVGHNFSAGATYRIRGSTVAGSFGSPVYDSGWLAAWDAIFLDSLIEWEEDAFWDSVPDMSGFSGGMPTIIHLMSVSALARYWLIEISDAANPDGYVEIGRVFVGRVWQPSVGMSFGASIGYADESTVDAAWSGTEFFDLKTTRRVASLRFDWLSDDEALGELLDIQRQAGITGEILFIWDPDDQTYRARRSFLARQESLSPVELVRVGTHGAMMKLRELV